MTHVNLRVQNLSDAVRFYSEVLGLEPIPRNDRGGTGAWFRLGNTEVHLAEDPTPQPRSKRHFAVEVTDLVEARREAEQNVWTARRVEVQLQDFSCRETVVGEWPAPTAE